MKSEIVEEFILIHPLFVVVLSFYNTLVEKSIDWEEWMPFGCHKGRKIVERYFESIDQ